jgi:large subunit ribosomal protein L10e
MRKSFGKPIGRAARVEPGQTLVEAYVNEDGIDTAKLALKRGEDKLPTTCRIFMEKIPKPDVKVKEVAS